MSQTRSRAISEAIFGSAARGDVDRLSDRDFLIVDDDVALLRRRAEELTADGWSVASYTFRKLEALSEKGALFVQHLKDESEIIHDSSRRLQNLLDAFRPKSSYLKELEENAQLAKLIEYRPKGITGALWSADVLYVSLRNFGVLRLAELGIYKFSFREIVENLSEIGAVNSRAPSDFLSLRFCKTLYRSGELSGFGRVNTLLSQCLPALPDDYFPQCSVQASSSYILFALSNSRNLPNPYVRLRAIEKGMIAADALNSKHFPPEVQAAIRRWIHNPRSYAFAANQFDLREFGNVLSNYDCSITNQVSVGR